MKQYLAIDIGASSGRHIVGWREDGELRTKEVYRFPNGVLEQNGHLVWDVENLVRHAEEDVAAVLAELENKAGCTYGKLYIEGGGAKKRRFSIISPPEPSVNM